MKTARWLTGAVLAMALAAPVEAQQPEVVDLRFQGNHAFSRSELSPAIVTRGSACRLLVLCWIGLGVETAELDPGALEADVFRLRVYYYERGFREARINADTTEVEAGKVRVTFEIQEGQPVRVERVEVDGLPGELSGRSLPLRSGAPFDVVAYEATRDTLQARMRNRGYAAGQVLLGYTIRREAPYKAVVRYDVFPGTLARFGAIEVQGTESASPELVHRMLTFTQGDLYDRSALLRSQRNLYGLRIFRHADVQADRETAADSVIPVTVRVAEGNMHSVRLGAGANNVECGNFEGQWTSRNFMGNGRRLTVRGRVGNLLINECGWLVNDAYTSYDQLTGLASVDFSQPWFFGPRNRLGGGLFAERRNVPNVFVRSALGGYVSLRRSLGRGGALTLAFRPELTELITAGDLFFCVNFVACTFEGIEDLRDPHWLAPVTLSFTMDRTDALFTPTDGFILRFDLEHAAGYTGSDFAYSRFLAEGSRYIGVHDGVVLATRFRGGVGVPHRNGTSEALGLNPQKRFFAGGANSVRGFDQYRLGPALVGIDAVPWLVDGDNPATAEVDGAGCTMAEVNSGTCDPGALSERRFDLRPSGGEVLLEANAELRFPMPFGGGSLRGALFVDAGQVWQTRHDVALAGIVATPGLGLRYQSPIGPIRVDAAFNTQGAQSLTVLTTAVETCLVDEPGCRRTQHRTPNASLRNTDNVVLLENTVRYGSALGEIGSVADFFNRFRIHFAIGQAF